MDFGPATYGAAYLAGILSTLSPCVLPLLPILIGAAVSEHRFGNYALAAGLTISFSVLGLFLATIGMSLGIDQQEMRKITAVFLILFGAILLAAPLHNTWVFATAGLGDFGNRILSRIHTPGLAGQFMVGLLLGIIWTPCVGPTLGAASTLATQGKNLGQVATLMFVFGIGAGTPLAALGTLSRSALRAIRVQLFPIAKYGKSLLGAALVIVGMVILTGAERSIETWILSVSPDWLTALTTRF